MNTGTLTVTDSKLLNNTATYYGGAIYNNDIAYVNFNWIIGNTASLGTQIYNYNTMNATDNWWGTNTPNTNGNDIVNYIKTSNYDPWIVLSINTTSPIDSIDSSTITTDLTHDNHGSNTSGTGYIPDGVLIQFYDTLGNVIGTETTSNGKAQITYTPNIYSGIETVNATANNANISINIIVNNLNIYVSTAGNDITGDGSHDNPYQTIKHGISLVSLKGTLYIANGIYNENNFQLNNDMTITGENQQNTIINGNNSGIIFSIGNNVNININNLTLTNGTSSYGGAIHNQGNLTEINDTFINNTATNYGGAVYNEGTLIDTNNTFINNTATIGGAIYNRVNGGTAILNINNSSYTQNNAIFGGAIYNSDNGGSAILNINNCIFTQNTASNYGGAIYNYGDSAFLNIINSTFTQNSANYNGGAIYIQSGSVTETNNTFTNNTANLAGAIDNKGILTDISNTFTNNTATYLGGAVYNEGNFTETNDSYNNNTATNYGGAIYNQGTLNETNDTFNNNTANYDGGAIYNNKGTVTETNNTFTNNTSHQGGAIENEGTLNLTTCSFKNNTATNYGGAIYNYGTITETNDTFNNNTAIAYGGGAINNQGTITEINNTFNNNTAIAYGGGAIINDGTLTETNNTFNNNTAVSYCGGAIINDGILIETNGTFTNNKATSNSVSYGGAIINYGTITDTNNTFTNNTATAGGAIYNQVNLTIINDIFNNNTSYQGGAIDNDYYGTMNVTASELLNNTAYFGGAIFNDGTANIHFSWIIGNNATYGTQIYSISEGINATDNWWGSNDGPSPGSIYGLNLKNWLVLRVTGNPTTITPGQTSTIKVDVLHDNGILNDPNNPELYYHSPSDGCIPDGIPVNLTGSLGNMDIENTTLIHGQAQSVFTATSQGMGNVAVSIDNQIVNTPIMIGPPIVSSIDPANNTYTNNNLKTITVTFDIPIKIGTSYNQITVTGPTGNISITTNINGYNLIITPNSNYTDGNYTINIPTNSITDLAGNNLNTGFTSSFTVDTITPTASANPIGGLYNSTQNIALSMNEPGTIYYTLNGTTPTNSSTIYSGPILINKTTTLNYIAIDYSGNISPVYTQTYIIDKTIPTASINVKGGLYKSNQTVKLTMSEPGNIYYTLNGTTPTSKSTPYTKPITISSKSTLKYIAIDYAKNKSSIYVQNYVIDKTTPKIVKTNPKYHAINIPLTTPITITFNKKIFKGINYNNIYIKNVNTGKLVQITKTVSKNTLTIKMTKSRIHNNKYIIYIPKGAFKDQFGNLTAKYTIPFKTG